MERSKKKRKFSFPHPLALLFAMVILAALLTIIIPAGEYEYETVDDITRVIPGTYHFVEKNIQTPWDVIQAVTEGMTRASRLMTMILFVGAAIYILDQTKSISKAFNKIASGKTKLSVIVFFVMLFMSIGGATGVFANATIALIPIGVILSKALGLDAATGFIMVYLGAYSGFNVGWANPSTLGVAHPIAELPVFSGFGVRVIFHIVSFIVTYLFAMKYIKTVQNDPTKSLNYGVVDNSELMGLKNESGEISSSVKLTTKDIINLGATGIAIGIVIIGSIVFGWSIKEITSTFLILSLFLGLYNGYGINGTSKLFVKGCSTVLGAAFAVGIANGISVILSDGRILNTIVYALSLPIAKVGSGFGAVLMFLANAIINLFIPSGSGQAAVVMPIMVPIADLTGITRQVAVQAFQFGDGFTNCIGPAASVLMGSLGLANVPWSKYAKRYLPFLIVQSVLASIALFILQSIGWTGL